MATPIIDANTITAIKDALTPVADKIGQGAEYVWTTVVTQQYVIGISSIIWSAFFATATIVAAVMSAKMAKTGKKVREGGARYSSEHEGWYVLAVLFGLGAVIFSFVSVVWISSGVMHLINPGYYALEFFITLGKSATGS